MFNLTLKYSIQFFLIIFLIGCNSEIKKELKVTSEVYYRILEATKESRAEVSFYKVEEPNTGPLTWDNVVFENRPMKKRQISESQIRYHIDLRSENTREEQLIKFWNKGDLPQEIRITPNKVNSFHLSNSTGDSINKIDKKEDCLLTADLAMPSFSGKITLLFTDEKNQTATVQVPSTDLSKPVQILPRMVAAVPTGECTVEIVLTKIEILDKGNVSGKIITEFYSKPITVSVSQ